MSTEQPTKREMKSYDEIRAEKKSQNKKKKLIAIIAAVIAIILIIIFCFGWTKGYRTIKLLEIFNKVTFDRGSQKDVDVYDGMSLKAGDTIKTGGDESFARLVLDDDKYIYIEENSEVNFEMAGRKNSSKTTLHLDHGAIVNELEHKLTDKQSFEVKSPNSLMAVRGTRFRVSTYVGPDGILYTRVSVLEGQVECWLVYPDGSVSAESHMAEVGSEVLMYYDDENGITDFAKSNEIGTYYAKKPGEYVSPIRYMQLPKQVIKYLYQRATKEGVVYEAVSDKELEQYLEMEIEYDEPIIDRYREEIAEYIAEHPEEFEDKKSVANAGDDANVDTTPTPAPLDDNTPDGTTPDDTDDANAEDGVDVANNGNDGNNGNNGGAPNNAAANNAVAKTTPTPTPSLADLIKQYYEEILNHPDVYAHLLPTPTPTPVVEVASAEESQPESNETPAQEQHDDNSNNTPAAPAAPAGGGSDPGSDPGTSGGDPSGGLTYEDVRGLRWPDGNYTDSDDDGNIGNLPEGYTLSKDGDGNIHLNDGSGYDRVVDRATGTFRQNSNGMPDSHTDDAGMTFTKSGDYDYNGNVKYTSPGTTNYYTVDGDGWHEWMS